MKNLGFSFCSCVMGPLSLVASLMQLDRNIARIYPPFPSGVAIIFPTVCGLACAFLLAVLK
jgi:hypothetical protein